MEVSEPLEGRSEDLSWWYVDRTPVYDSYELSQNVPPIMSHMTKTRCLVGLDEPGREVDGFIF